MHFASDNTSGAAPEILTAIASANDGYAPSYGAEAAMDEVRTRVRQVFEAPEAEVFLVATGTAANALSLACHCPPWGAVFCHEHAHIETDECGGPEFYIGGGKLVLVPGEHGKMSPAALAAAIDATPEGDVHSVQRCALSLSNATEAGTVYKPAELAALGALAKEHGLPVHLDGARFANAVAATGANPAEMSWKAGIDVLSFGGTKNGCVGVEAVILFDPARAFELELRRKRGGHLLSKHRFLSAQVQAYLADDLWRRLATAANQKAAELEAAILSVPGVALVHPREVNIVFADLPRAMHRRARLAGAQYYLQPGSQSLEGADDEALTARFVCSWCTTSDEIADFLRVIRDPD